MGDVRGEYVQRGNVRLASPHQLIFTAEQSFYGRRNIRRVPRGQRADDAVWVELIEKT